MQGARRNSLRSIPAVIVLYVEPLVAERKTRHACSSGEFSTATLPPLAPAALLPKVPDRRPARSGNSKLVYRISTTDNCTRQKKTEHQMERKIEETLITQQHEQEEQESTDPPDNMGKDDPSCETTGVPRDHSGEVKGTGSGDRGNTELDKLKESAEGVPLLLFRVV